jgi:hypothetical protein
MVELRRIDAAAERRARAAGWTDTVARTDRLRRVLLLIGCNARHRGRVLGHFADCHAASGGQTPDLGHPSRSMQ